MTVPRAADAGRLPEFIGRYRVVDRLGKGAMGVVYAADDEATGRRVAVKVMAADLEDEPEIRERFYREARITGQLAHRNIVTVFDLGEDRGHPYLVMELLAGLPLSAHLATPAARALDAKIDLLVQVSEGLQAAHAGGVVHRDLKPSNLFVQTDGTVKILDFGVARLAGSTLTMGSSVLGTPEYMSPEQARGQRVDVRSDIFSAGAVFYYVLTGRSPFAQGDLTKTLQAVVHENPAPLAEADAPELLRHALMKALAKAPDARYQQCADMLADLKRVQRAYEGATHRIAQAALDRYRQIVALIEERRTLGRSLGVEQIEATCDDAVARLAVQFPLFARLVTPSSLLEPMDRDTASAALAELQARYNTEAASLAALGSAAEAAAIVDIGDLTLHRTAAPSDSAAAPDEPGSIGGRAAALWRRLRTPPDGSGEER